MINQRQAHILSLVVQDFIANAQPVASKIIVEKYNIGVSPATVRNDMVVLEAVGLLRQPHTSSGRIPTEEGYRFYLEHFVDPNNCKKIGEPLERAICETDTHKQKLKEMARVLVELSGETALSSLDTQWNHFSGISNLFDKPDFYDMDMMRSLSAVVDQFDGVLQSLYDSVDQDVNVWIGAENPFGKQIATVMVKYELPNGVTGLLGLVGPLRMDYERNIKLLSEAKGILGKDL